MIKRRQISMS